MRGLGDDAGALVEPHHAPDLVGQLHLRALVPIALGEDRRIAVRGALHERGQPLAQLGEDGLQVRGARARLERVQQGVVGLVADADGLGLLPLQAHDLAQGGRVGRVVVRAPGLGPRADGSRAGLGDLPHQGLRDADGPVTVVLDQAHHRPGVVVQARIGGEPVEHLAHILAHDLAMAEGGQRAHLTGAPLGPGRGHQGLAIPPQQHLRPGEVREGAHPLGERGPVRGRRAHARTLVSGASAPPPRRIVHTDEHAAPPSTPRLAPALGGSAHRRAGGHRGPARDPAPVVDPRRAAGPAPGPRLRLRGLLGPAGDGVHRRGLPLGEGPARPAAPGWASPAGGRSRLAGERRLKLRQDPLNVGHHRRGAAAWSPFSIASSRRPSTSLTLGPACATAERTFSWAALGARVGRELGDGGVEVGERLARVRDHRLQVGEGASLGALKARAHGEQRGLRRFQVGVHLGGGASPPVVVAGAVAVVPVAVVVGAPRPSSCVPQTVRPSSRALASAWPLRRLISVRAPGGRPGRPRRRPPGVRGADALLPLLEQVERLAEGAPRGRTAASGPRSFAISASVASRPAVRKAETSASVLDGGRLRRVPRSCPWTSGRSRPPGCGTRSR